MTRPPPVVAEVTVQDLLQENLIFSLYLGKSFPLGSGREPGGAGPPVSPLGPPGRPSHLGPAPPSPASLETGQVTPRLGDRQVQQSVVSRHPPSRWLCLRLRGATSLGRSYCIATSDTSLVSHIGLSKYTYKYFKYYTYKTLSNNDMKEYRSMVEL